MKSTEFQLVISNNKRFTQFIKWARLRKVTINQFLFPCSVYQNKAKEPKLSPFRIILAQWLKLKSIKISHTLKPRIQHWNAINPYQLLSQTPFCNFTIPVRKNALSNPLCSYANCLTIRHLINQGFLLKISILYKCSFAWPRPHKQPFVTDTNDKRADRRWSGDNDNNLWIPWMFLDVGMCIAISYSLSEDKFAQKPIPGRGHGTH